jgi:hypothetical protein
LRHLDRELHSSNETAVLDEVRREIPPEQLPRPTA